MFCNTNLDEIFIINEDTLEIHRVSHMSGKCGFRTPDSDSCRCTILPSLDQNATLWMLREAFVKEKSYDFCGHCFPGMSKR